MFFDEVNVVFEGGRGGNGAVYFHREKFVSAGSPDGGDAGKGGSVILIADSNFNTLHHFVGPKHFKAKNGVDGHKNNRAGANGEDLVLKVPPGTQIYDANTDELIVDLKESGAKFIAAAGGRGGFGNAHFVSSTRQAPQFAELGDRGDKLEIRLELQLVADVGLVGFPSSGKSTLISHVSAAKPKIGDYPFTTLVPNLGVVQLSQFGGGKEQTFVIADIPGIIEGASEGKGLGGKFLRHISRTAILIFLLDPFSYDGKSVEDQYSILKKELEKHSDTLTEKKYLVVINKIDAIPDEDRDEIKVKFLKKFPEEKEFYRMTSGVSGELLSELMKELWNIVQTTKEKIPKAEESDEVKIYEPIRMIDDHSFEVKKMTEVELDGFELPVHGQVISAKAKPMRVLYVVKGERIQQISRMTNVDQRDGIRRIYDILKKMHIQDELKRQGAINGDLVRIDEHVFEYHNLDI